MGINNVKLGVRATKKTTPVPPPPAVDRHNNHANGPIITRSNSTTTKPATKNTTPVPPPSPQPAVDRHKNHATGPIITRSKSTNTKPTKHEDTRLGKRPITISSSSTTSRAKPTSTPSMETEKPIEIVDLDDEEYFYFTPNIPHKGITMETAISVEQYNEDRDLQIAITASLIYNDGDDDDLRILTVKPENTPFGRKTKPFSSPSITETGQSPNSKSNNNDDPPFVCEICFETKNSNESFKIKGCSHPYCVDCISKYVASKLQDNVTSISCPESDCRGLLEPEYCRNLLPQDVFDRWDNALCESVILGAQKFYCPFKDCSALLIDEGEAISQSECPNCNRLFCAQCKVAWHFGIECAEFQKLTKGEREREDIMLMNLAQKQKWKRCPNCGFYVEKKDGCMYMKCRCRTAFCYNCGNVADALNHTFHYCSKCKR